MLLAVLTVFYALFVWWFSTGLIIYLDNLPRRTHGWSMAAATALLAASIYGLHAGRDDTNIVGAYAAFTYAVFVWGWQELSFFTGIVTGPLRTPCPEGCRGWRRFVLALQACLYHEFAILASVIVVILATRGGSNQVGYWTFMILWAMRQSAKLNVFFGVRNLVEEFLPPHLAFIGSYMRRRPMNLLFPVSITMATIACAIVVVRAAAATDPYGVAGLTLAATMLVLGLLEHWLMMLPLPFAALWTWSLDSAAMGVRAPQTVRMRTVGENQ